MENNIRLYVQKYLHDNNDKISVCTNFTDFNSIIGCSYLTYIIYNNDNWQYNIRQAVDKLIENITNHNDIIEYKIVSRHNIEYELIFKFHKSSLIFCCAEHFVEYNLYILTIYFNDYNKFFNTVVNDEWQKYKISLNLTNIDNVLDLHTFYELSNINQSLYSFGDYLKSIHIQHNIINDEKIPNVDIIVYHDTAQIINNRIV